MYSFEENIKKVYETLLLCGCPWTFEEFVESLCLESLDVPTVRKRTEHTEE